MKFFVAIAVVAATPAMADVSFEYENFQMTQTGAAELVLKFSNETDRVVTFVAADCAFLGGDKKAISTGPVIAQNVAPRSYAYGKTYSPKDSRIKSADCRIRDVDYAD